jgi:hypothetical protein
MLSQACKVRVAVPILFWDADAEVTAAGIKQAERVNAKSRPGE